MPTTEVLVATLVAGADIGDPDNASAKVAKETFDFDAQQPGFQNAHLGMQKENPNVLTVFVDWDNVQSHKNFEASESYGPFYQRFTSIVDGKPQLVHVDFTPEAALPKALSAPITEVAFFIFGGEVPSSYAAGVDKFAAAVEKEKPDGFLSAAYGFTLEEFEHDGVKGKAAVLVIGWQSIDAHLAFRETPTFKEHIHLLRDGVSKAQLVHVKFLPFVPGS